MSSAYTAAARILEQLENEKGTLKSFIYSNDFPNKRIISALVIESLKYLSIIDELLDDSHFFSSNKRLSRSVQRRKSLRYLVIVMVYDLLFSDGKSIHGGGSLKKTILKHKSCLSSCLVRMKIKRGAVDNVDLLPPSHRVNVESSIPRYARVNTIKSNVDDVIGFFSGGDDDAPLLDNHIPHLLVFPPRTDLHDHRLVLDGKLILQGKASCFPAYALSPPPGSVVIDACAAPGNKTTALAALMKNNGKIIAMDRDEVRLGTLKRNASLVGASIIDARCGDFLEINPEDHKDVTHILVDPSCSGSGIVGRMDHLVKELGGEAHGERDGDRLDRLACFQRNALEHALSFPNVSRVVYSTCSVHDVENECVVASVLESEVGKKFKLGVAMEAWEGRGRRPHRYGGGDEGGVVEEVVDYEACVRMDPGAGTIGFFVALFERKKKKKRRRRRKRKRGDVV